MAHEHILITQDIRISFRIYEKVIFHFLLILFYLLRMQYYNYYECRISLLQMSVFDKALI